MPTAPSMDVEVLVSLNQEICDLENAARPDAIAERYVAPMLAFRRRDGTFVDREGFIASPRAGRRVLTNIEVYLHGGRAVVTCLITEDGVMTHNLKLFTRRGEQWQLMAWANEPT